MRGYLDILDQKKSHMTKGQNILVMSSENTQLKNNMG